MNEDIIEQARREYEEDGIVSVSTYARLEDRGFDAASIINEIAEEKN